jgi:uncharacterized protein with HEPN domain
MKDDLAYIEHILQAIEKIRNYTKDKLIHDYMGIDMDVVWKTLGKDIPELESLLRKISM